MCGSRYESVLMFSCCFSASPHIRTDQGKTADNEDEATARHMQCKFVSQKGDNASGYNEISTELCLKPAESVSWCVSKLVWLNYGVNSISHKNMIMLATVPS